MDNPTITVPAEDYCPELVLSGFTPHQLYIIALRLQEYVVNRDMQQRFICTAVLTNPSDYEKSYTHISVLEPNIIPALGRFADAIESALGCSTLTTYIFNKHKGADTHSVAMAGRRSSWAYRIVNAILAQLRSYTVSIEIVNAAAVNTWLRHHTIILNHTCFSRKAQIPAYMMQIFSEDSISKHNILWQDAVTGEVIRIQHRVIFE